MINVFCNKRGSGKTKALIDLANQKIHNADGQMVYIDDDKRPMYSLDRRIRFITTEDYEVKDCNEFYGLLCGILSGNYDIDMIFVDGLNNIVSGSMEDMAHLFCKLESFCKKNGVEMYINLNSDIEKEGMPEFLKKYVKAA